MSGIQYRPSIDGMRAIAVLAVLVFHLDTNLLPGGFVGVDVFFAISGYLITSIIFSATQSNTFSIAHFYQRRIARIFPVLFVVTLTILVVASLLYTHQDFASAGALAAASVLSVANMKLMLQGNYFELSPDSQPFLHFWSLSVEEQFYVFLPLLMFAAQRFKLNRKSVLWILWILALSSFILCLYVTAIKPTWAFYLLPTRAWELLAGAILAVMTHDTAKAQRRDSGIWAAVGLVLILLSMILISEEHAFPGYIAAIPIIGSLLVIGRTQHPDQWTERFLSHPIMIWIGKRSYSLYLWHWPVYCFVDYGMFDEPTWLRTGLKVALTLGFAMGSYALVETPLRVFLNLPRNRNLGYAGLAAGVLIVTASGISIRNNNYITTSIKDVAKGGIQFRVAPEAPKVVLMGDSHGSMYGLLAKALATEDELNVNVISVAAADPIPDSQLYKESIKCLQSCKPDVTLFIASWASKIDHRRDKMEFALQEILQHSSYVILITEPPVLPSYASRQRFRETGLKPVFEEPEVSEKRQRTNAYIRSLESERIRVVEVESLYQNPDGTIIFCDEEGRQLFHNKTHLSGWGALLAKPMVSHVISDLLNSNTLEQGRRSQPPLARLPTLNSDTEN